MLVPPSVPGAPAPPPPDVSLYAALCGAFAVTTIAVPLRHGGRPCGALLGLRVWLRLCPGPALPCSGVGLTGSPLGLASGFAEVMQLDLPRQPHRRSQLSSRLSLWPAVLAGVHGRGESAEPLELQLSLLFVLLATATSRSVEYCCGMGGAGVGLWLGHAPALPCALLLPTSFVVLAMGSQLVSSSRPRSSFARFPALARIGINSVAAVRYRRSLGSPLCLVRWASPWDRAHKNLQQRAPPSTSGAISVASFSCAGWSTRPRGGHAGGHQNKSTTCRTATKTHGASRP